MKRGPLAWFERVVGVPSPERGTPGEPGLFGAGSAVWLIGRERVLLLGGPAALLMQIAHPLVAAAVAGHSDFRRDPFRRLRATLGAVLAISFGDRGQAERAAQAVRTVHAGVQGRLPAPAGPFPAGAPYAASDPALAMWVHATLVVTALEAFGRFVRPPGPVERERYVRETKRFAALFGVTPDVMPSTVGAFDRYVEDSLDRLWVGEPARSLAREILDPPVPLALRASVPWVRIATAGLLPAPIRRAYELPWGRPERLAFGVLTRSIRGTLPLWPARLRYWPQYLTALERMRSGDAAAD